MINGLDFPVIIAIIVLFCWSVGKLIQAVADWREQVRWEREGDNEGHDGFIW